MAPTDRTHCSTTNEASKIPTDTSKNMTSNVKVSERLFQRLSKTQMELMSETDDDESSGFSNIFVRILEYKDDMVNTESHTINYRMHPMLMLHSMLNELHKMLVREDGLNGNLDLALVVKVPSDLKSRLGDEVIVRMGADLGELDKGVADRIVNAILMKKVDALILKAFLDAEKETAREKSTANQGRKKQNRKKK